MASTGSRSDFEAQNRAPLVIAVIWAATAVMTLFVVSRVYCRAINTGRRVRKLQADDWLILTSASLIWIHVCLETKAFSSGAGRHIQTLTDQQITSSLYWYAVSSWPGVLSLCLPKIAIVVLLCRLLNPRPWHRALLWSLAVICTINFVLAALFGMISCDPPRATWDVSITVKQCWDPWVLMDFFFYAASFSAFLDLYLAIYPAVVFRKLHVDTRKKLTLSFLLGCGVFASGVAIYKTTQIQAFASNDFTYACGPMIIWTVLEACTIVVAACIPTLHPLYDKIHGKLRPRNQRFSIASTLPIWNGGFGLGSKFLVSVPSHSEASRRSHMERLGCYFRDRDRDGERDMVEISHVTSTNTMNEGDAPRCPPVVILRTDSVWVETEPASKTVEMV
ncbi:hypothetical protein JX265_000388 [Neoarthrinium moseri]|uniref:Rhodopsin domain-containing protein n=1 Tax=Neoarthrinium moseri TaxID=1658444 RepID=A0A9P9WYS0_9PEZI|nr:hypothetical protein JX265_000388 [Neoarthrinium moseri]